MAVTPSMLYPQNDRPARFSEVEVTGVTTLIGAVTAPAGITGNVTGNVTGTVTGAMRQSQILTATGAITVGSNGIVQLNHATVVIAATLAAPAAGYDLIIVDNSASGTAAHTVTLPAGVTFDGTNNTATLNAPGEALHLVALSATRWFIMENIGSVALSNV
jgi:putative copper export protein